MIVTRFRGGLGNQLFIYAAAKSLSVDLNKKMLLETKSGYYKDAYNRVYELDKLCITEEKTGILTSFIYLLKEKYPNLIVLIYKIFRGRKICFINETDHVSKFDLDSDDLKNDYIFMDTYWQCEDYFIKHRELIKSNLVSKNLNLILENEILGKIKSTNSVCVHVRIQKNLSSDGKVVGSGEKNLPVNYFRNAIMSLNEKIENASFYIFSDNPSSVQNALDLKIGNVHFINQGDHSNPTTDFLLMTQCKHYIISNSSFSWWGAWLSENENKIIYAPPINYWDYDYILPKKWNIFKDF